MAVILTAAEMSESHFRATPHVISTDQPRIVPRNSKQVDYHAKSGRNLLMSSYDCPLVTEAISTYPFSILVCER